MSLINYTENQKKYIRLAYELAISIMLVISLEMYNAAYAEGSADCKIWLHRQGEFYGLYDANYTSVPQDIRQTYFPNISVKEIGTNVTVPVVIFPLPP